MERVYARQPITVIELASQYDALDDAARQLDVLVQQQCATADPPLLVLDMRETRSIGSTFLSMLFRAGLRLRDRGGQLAVCHVAPFCAEVLEVVRSQYLVRHFDTLEEAVDELTSELSSN